MRLGWSTRPASVSTLQAAAAVGQMGLIDAYARAFEEYDLRSALVLLAHDDLSNRQRYLNARATLRELLRLGVVPVINENDTVATEEIRFGDNDTLSALVANLLEADVLLILTDQQGLHAEDPRSNPEAPVVTMTQASNPELEAMAGTASGRLGVGGMLTKVRAARTAARSGASTVIAYGRTPDVVGRVLAGERVGSLLLADQPKLAARKRWIAGHLAIKGQVRLDQGAVRVLQKEGRSLLPVGVTAVSGDFARGDVVACLDGTGREVARGLVNYSAQEISRILGCPSDQIQSRLGYPGEPELVHRDNMVLT